MSEAIKAGICRNGLKQPILRRVQNEIGANFGLASKDQPALVGNRTIQIIAANSYSCTGHGP